MVLIEHNEIINCSYHFYQRFIFTAAAAELLPGQKNGRVRE